MKANVYDIQTVSRLNDCPALEQEWASFTHKCIGASFYHDYAWYQQLTSHLTNNVSFLLAHHGRMLVAVIPVDLTHKTILRLPRCSQTDLTDILLHKDHCNPVLLESLKLKLNQLKPGWAEFQIHNTPVTGGVYQLMNSAPTFNNFDQDRVRYYFETSHPENLDSLPKKLKKNIARQSRSLKKDFGEITVSDTTLETFLQIDRQSWKGIETNTNIESNKHHEAFYRGLAEVYGLDGRLHLQSLNVDGNPIAVQFGLQSGPVLSLLKIAYISEFHKYAPGNQLLLHLINQCIQPECSVQEVSLTTGPDWAKRWHPKAESVYNIRCFSNSFAGRLSRLQCQFINKLRLVKQAIATRMRREN